MSGKQIIKITEEQVEHFAGNMLQVLGHDEQPDNCNESSSL